MAHAGETLVNPVTGFQLNVWRTAEETAGALLELEATYPAGSQAPPEHYHPRQEEDFEVLEGSVRLRVAGETRDLRAGETLKIRPNVVHAMWNPSAEPVRVLWQTRPALKTLDLFDTLMTLARLGRVDAHGRPALLDLALLLRTYREEMRVTTPPALVQYALIAVVAPIARLRGRNVVAEAA